MLMVGNLVIREGVEAAAAVEEIGGLILGLDLLLNLLQKRAPRRGIRSRERGKRGVHNTNSLVYVFVFAGYIDTTSCSLANLNSTMGGKWRKNGLSYTALL